MASASSFFSVRPSPPSLSDADLRPFGIAGETHLIPYLERFRLAPQEFLHALAVEPPQSQF